MLEKLSELGIRQELIDEIAEFRKNYPVEEAYASRVPLPKQFYYGKEVWEQAVTALLCGENILLVGHKATGKNIFAENLAGVFGRPRWDVSFHVNMDAASLIGMDTFRNGEVTFRPGPVYTAARTGGFTVLDEINMAKSEAMAVLHATLDFRKTIDELRIFRDKRIERGIGISFCGNPDANDIIRKPGETDLQSISRYQKRGFGGIGSSIFGFTEEM